MLRVEVKFGIYIYDLSVRNVWFKKFSGVIFNLMMNFDVHG